MTVTSKSVDQFNSNGTTIAGKTLSNEAFEERLAKLVNRWKAHDDKDLALRHETGALLNLRYGYPSQRQRRGAKTMKKASERLGILESELSRMRWFAHHFQSVDVLRARYPQVKNWTQVRELLCKLSKDGKATAAPVTEKSNAAFLKVRRALAALTSAFKGIGTAPSPEERKELRGGLQDFVSALPPGLGIRLVVDDVGDLDESTTALASKAGVA